MENSKKLSFVLIVIIFILLFSNVYLFKHYESNLSLKEYYYEQAISLAIKNNKSTFNLIYPPNKKVIIIKNESKKMATRSN